MVGASCTHHTLDDGANMNSLRQLFDAIRGLLVWWVVVAPWEQAIRVRLGKHVELLGPGVHLRIPGADRYYLQSVRTRISSLPPQTLTTKDGRSLTISVSLRYAISDLLVLYNTLHHAEGTLANIVLGAVGEFVMEHNLVDCQPGTIGPWVVKRINLSRYGLKDASITVLTFAAVKTYRLIMGDGQAWLAGDSLDTAREHEVISSSSGPV